MSKIPFQGVRKLSIFKIENSKVFFLHFHEERNNTCTDPHQNDTLKSFLILINNKTCGNPVCI